MRQSKTRFKYETVAELLAEDGSLADLAECVASRWGWFRNSTAFFLKGEQRTLKELLEQRDAVCLRFEEDLAKEAEEEFNEQFALYLKYLKEKETAERLAREIEALDESDPDLLILKRLLRLRHTALALKPGRVPKPECRTGEQQRKLLLTKLDGRISETRLCLAMVEGCENRATLRRALSKLRGIEG